MHRPGSSSHFGVRQVTRDGEITRVLAGPQPVRPAEVGNAGIGRDPCAGQHGDVGLLRKVAADGGDPIGRRHGG